MGWGCVNVGKGGDVERLYGADRAQAMIAEAADSYGHFDQLIEREGIDCLYRRSGRFVGAHTPAAYAGMAKSVQNLNAHAEAGAFLVPRERDRKSTRLNSSH